MCNQLSARAVREDLRVEIGLSSCSGEKGLGVPSAMIGRIRLCMAALGTPVLLFPPNLADRSGTFARLWKATDADIYCNIYHVLSENRDPAAHRGWGPELDCIAQVAQQVVSYPVARAITPQIMYPSIAFDAFM